MELERGQSIIGEFENISLGDKRLERRLSVIARAMELAPEESLVEQAGTVAALEATYRFLSNPRVKPEAIFAGHAHKTVERAAAHERVLVVHDTTEFRFGGAKQRRGLGCISTKKRDGFLAHYSLCLAPDGEPLGSLELFAWSRPDPEKRSKAKGTLRDPDRESLRWLESAERASRRLFGHCTPIHVMDREGDQFELFASLLDCGEHFVVRLGHDRRLKKGRGRDGHPMLNEVLELDLSASHAKRSWVVASGSPPQASEKFTQNESLEVLFLRFARKPLMSFARISSARICQIAFV